MKPLSKNFCRRKTVMSQTLQFIKQNTLLFLSVCSVIIGLILGFSLRQSHLSPNIIELINFPGEIFLQVLKMMTLPLIFSSLISALAQLDPKASGQMGVMTVGYYFMTTSLATALGIFLVLAIRPGNSASIKMNEGDVDEKHTPISSLDTFLDLIRNMFPENVIQATFQRAETNYYKENKVKNLSNLSLINTTIQKPTTELKKRVDYVEGMNILGIIVFCTSFGIVISQLGERAKNMVDFFVILEAAIMKLVETFMWIAPIGIICLIAGNLLKMKDLAGALSILSLYVGTILCGLAIHSFITMPLLYFLLTRKNPLLVVRGMTRALVTTFGTSSSGAALPVSLQCMEDKVKVDRRITRFVLPLGTTINLDGNALYEAVAVIFIAQLHNVELSIVQIFTISFITTISSLGMNSVPAGLISIIRIFKVVGLPATNVPMLLTVDWLIDRIRTSMTVLGDAFAASVIAHYLHDTLEENDKNKYHHEIKEEIKMLRQAAMAATNGQNSNLSKNSNVVYCKNNGNEKMTRNRRHSDTFGL